MNSLVYLLVTSAKNSLLELKKKPGKLIAYLFVIGFIALSVVSSVLIEHSKESFVPLFWFKGIFFALITLFAVVAIVKGLSTGDTFFEMSDVNLLFVSPVNPRKILLYGIVKLTKISFLAGFFILFQTGSLTSNFGIAYNGILLIFFTFMLCIILLTVLSLIIYNIANGSIKRKFFVKVISVGVFMPALVYFAVQFLNTGDMAGAVESSVKSPFLTWIPVAGWISEGVTGILMGNTWYGLGFIGLTVIVMILLTVYVVFSRTDYYEDVLCATETAFEKKRNTEEGNVNASVTSRKVKVTKMGIGGLGGSAIFSKHLRENFRESRFGFFGVSSLLIILGSVGAAFFMPEGSNIIMIMQVLMWMQIFLIGTGRGLKELYMHYIYLIPVPSFSKIIWSNMEIVFKTLVESIFIFGISGFILKDNLIIIMGAIITYTLFSLFLIGVNYVSIRCISADISAGILLMLYMLAVVILMLPGVVPALIVGYSVGGNTGIMVGLLIVIVWETLVGLVCFWISKGVLHDCDMPVMKTGK